MKAIAKKIEKMMEAIDTYKAVRAEYEKANAGMKHDYYDYDLGDGTTVKRMTDETEACYERYLNAVEETKKALKAAGKAITSAAASLGITVKADLRNEDSLIPTALRIKARYEAAIDAINNISRYDSYLEPSNREYAY